MPEIDSLYDDLGEPRLRSLVAAFYRRVRTDDLLGPLYPQDDWEGAEKRLADFLIGRFGGPPIYIEQRGHPRLRMRHMPFAIGVPERDRWMKMMEESMIEVELPPPAIQVLTPFFAQVADFLRNQS